MVAGDPATMWDLIAATDQTAVVGNRPGMHTDPRLHPARCRPFRLGRLLGARVLGAHDRIKVKYGTTITQS